MMWLGNVIPNYAINSVQAFKNKYLDYNIEFIRYKIQDITRICNGNLQSDIDKVLYNTIQQIFYKNNDSLYLDYIKNQKMIYGKNIKNIMLISDIFRLELLNTFGGIYIDIDSIPGITFDEQLLSYNRFCVSRKSGQKIISDNYFMGQIENYEYWLNPMDQKFAVQVFDSTKQDILFQYRRSKFIKGLPIDLNNNFYIEHYMVRSWETFNGKIIDDFYI